VAVFSPLVDLRRNVGPINVVGMLLGKNPKIPKNPPIEVGCLDQVDTTRLPPDTGALHALRSSTTIGCVLCVLFILAPHPHP